MAVCADSHLNWLKQLPLGVEILASTLTQDKSETLTEARCPGCNLLTGCLGRGLQLT